MCVFAAERCQTPIFGGSSDIVNKKLSVLEHKITTMTFPPRNNILLKTKFGYGKKNYHRSLSSIRHQTLRFVNKNLILLLLLGSENSFRTRKKIASNLKYTMYFDLFLYVTRRYIFFIKTQSSTTRLL